MSCAQMCHEADTVKESRADEHLEAGLAQRASDRQAAVLYLHAAGLTDDAVARDLLRRRGVELLLRRPGAPCPRRAC